MCSQMRTYFDFELNHSGKWCFIFGYWQHVFIYLSYIEHIKAINNLAKLQVKKWHQGEQLLKPCQYMPHKMRDMVDWKKY